MRINPNKTYTKEDLLRQLAALGIPRSGMVLVHSSLRLIGKVEGGAQTVLDALIEYFTADGGLLCIPTHTWAFLNREITLDMTTPATCLGAIPDLAVADPRGVRSENPTHSMVVFGDRARALALIDDDARLPSGTAPSSCYGKLYQNGGHVLLVGVSHSRNTYLHCVEEMLDMPNRLSQDTREVTVKRANGELVTRRVRTHYADFTTDISMRFPQYETAFRYHGAITDGFLGNAPVQACDAVIMKETMELIMQRCDGADPLANERQIDPKLYC